MKKTIIAAVALVAMTACNKTLIETPMTDSNYGYINLGITADTEMVVTKGIESEATLDGYNVTLLNNGQAVSGWPKEFSEIEDGDFKVLAGNYTIYVENLTEEETYETSNGVVRVSGETNVTVTAGVTSACTVACTPQNSKVSFVYNNDFETVFGNSNSIVVKESDSRSVNMTAVRDKHAEAKPAYFKADTELEWTLTVKQKDANDGNKEITKTYSNKFTTVKAKWTQVTFSTGSTAGEIKVTVTVNNEITDCQTITAVVDPLGDTVDQTVNN